MKAGITMHCDNGKHYCVTAHARKRLIITLAIVLFDVTHPEECQLRCLP